MRHVRTQYALGTHDHEQTRSVFDVDKNGNIFMISLHAASVSRIPDAFRRRIGSRHKTGDSAMDVAGLYNMRNMNTRLATSRRCVE